jgi:hypothetical protein
MIRFIAILITVALIASSAFAQELGDPNSPNLLTSSDLESAAQVKDYYANWLSSFPGVSGVGVGKNEKGQPAIIVDVSEMNPQIKKLPERLNGVPVVVSVANGAGVAAQGNDDDAALAKGADADNTDANQATAAQPNVGMSGASNEAGGSGPSPAQLNN